MQRARDDVDQARISLEADRFRLRFALLALRIDHATEMQSRVEAATILDGVERYAAETAADAERVNKSVIAPAKGRTAERAGTFLMTILVPSVRVLRAAALLELLARKTDAENEVAHLKRAPAPDPPQAGSEEVAEIQNIIKAVTADPTAMTYRVRYNLACFWSRVASSGLAISTSADASLGDGSPAAESQPLLVSYRQLRRGLEQAPFGEQLELAKLARVDPSLQRLRDDELTASLTRLLLAEYLVSTDPEFWTSATTDAADSSQTSRLTEGTTH